MEGFDNVIQAPFGSFNQEDHTLKGLWNTSFFRNNNPIILELGCGKGEYTVSLGRQYPDCNFIGVDIKGARMWKGAKEAIEQNLTNVAFLRTNIELIDRFFATGEVDRIWLTFPDPQMKNTRRRLTSVFFMEKYRKILKPEATIHLKTDSNFQYNYTLEMLRKNKLEILTNIQDLPLASDNILSIQTFYEKQWRERGIPIKYLVFRLNESMLDEPDVEIEMDAYRSFGRSARE